MGQNLRAVLFDFGGVILSSPFEAFAHYEQANGLPNGAIRTINATDPDTNAWAHLERSDVSIDEFCDRFESEGAALGFSVDARAVLGLLAGELRPAMVEALRRIHADDRFLTALLTNNIVSMSATSPVDGPTGSTAMVADDRADAFAEVFALFDVIVESSKVGVRKPEARFYEVACALLDIEPHEAVFLDDLGVNLKPAHAMGMITIKVVDPDDALAQLEALIDLDLRTA